MPDDARPRYLDCGLLILPVTADLDLSKAPSDMLLHDLPERLEDLPRRRTSFVSTDSVIVKVPGRGTLEDTHLAERRLRCAVAREETRARLANVPAPPSEVADRLRRLFSPSR